MDQLSTAMRITSTLGWRSRLQLEIYVVGLRLSSKFTQQLRHLRRPLGCRRKGASSQAGAGSARRWLQQAKGAIIHGHQEG